MSFVKRPRLTARDDRQFVVAESLSRNLPSVVSRIGTPFHSIQLKEQSESSTSLNYETS